MDRDDVFALDPDQVEAILPRYDAPVPRYTSYPTAPVWSESYADLPQQQGSDRPLFSRAV
jgi:hypothetical protein